MAIVTLHHIASHEPSTKIGSTVSRSYNCTFRDGCSIYTPMVLINDHVDNLALYNFMTIDANWYKIDEIQLESYGLYSVSGTFDPLKTYRAEILASSQFIARSETPGIAPLTYEDSLYPPVGLVTASSTYGSAGMPFTAAGTYILRILGGNAPGAVSGIASYAMTETQLRAFAAYCSSLNNKVAQARNLVDKLGTALKTIAADVKRLIQTGSLDWGQYIKSCHWVPINYDSIVSGQTNIQINDLDTGCTAGVIDNDSVIVTAASINFPTHPQAAERGYWLNMARAKYYMYLPGLGLIDFNRDMCGSSPGLDIAMEFSWADGSVRYNLYTQSTSAECVGSYDTNVAVNIPLASASGSFLQAVPQLISGTAKMATAAYTGNPNSAIAGASDYAHGMMSAFASYYGLTVQSGGSGGRAGAYSNQVYITGFYGHIYDKIPDTGEIINSVKTLGDLTGFTQTVNAHITLSGGRTADQDEVCRLLDGGVHIE